jgi:Na+/H+-dicarboxylate symporter
MMGVVYAIDWFLDRFRTALNVSGDLFGAMVVQKMTGIKDMEDEDSGEPDDARCVLPQHDSRV